MNTFTLHLNTSNDPLVIADEHQIQVVENNYYIHPDCIDNDRFKLSDRVYLCPAKGRSYWVDLLTEHGWINDICWVYPEPKHDYEHILGWYGFYPTHRKYEIEI